MMCGVYTLSTICDKQIVRLISLLISLDNFPSNILRSTLLEKIFFITLIKLYFLLLFNVNAEFLIKNSIEIIIVLSR